MIEVLESWILAHYLDTLIRTLALPQLSEHAYFSTSDPQYMINNTSNAGKSVFNSGDSFRWIESYFGRVNFGYAGKYLLTSSIYSWWIDQIWVWQQVWLIPLSGAFKWKMSEEGFLPQAINELSFRLGYGVTGNQCIGYNLYDGRTKI